MKLDCIVVNNTTLSLKKFHFLRNILHNDYKPLTNKSTPFQLQSKSREKATVNPCILQAYGWEDLALNSFLEMNCGSQKLVGQTTEGAWSRMLSELMPSLSLA